jgi:hypothetical protein
VFGDVPAAEQPLPSPTQVVSGQLPDSTGSDASIGSANPTITANITTARTLFDFSILLVLKVIV